jgi:hypothetical protein
MEEALRAIATVLWALVAGMGVGEAVIIIPGARRAGAAAGLRAFGAMGRFGWRIVPPMAVLATTALALLVLLSDESGATATLTIVALAAFAAAILVALGLYKPADTALFSLSEEATEDEYGRRLTRVHRAVNGRAVLYVLGLVVLVVAPLV